jgi:plasmid maintenance system antidote protein VapI
MEDAGISIAEFTSRTGICEADVRNMLAGVDAITNDDALWISRAFGVEKEFLLVLEANYQSDLKRLGLERPKEGV